MAGDPRAPPPPAPDDPRDDGIEPLRPDGQVDAKAFDEEEETDPEEMPRLGPDRPPDTYYRALAEASADRVLVLQQFLAEAAAERDVLVEKLAAAEARLGAQAAEIVKLKVRVNQMIGELKKRKT